MAKRIGSLEIDEDEKHERCFWKIERIAWYIWALVLIAAVCGLLGPGPLSKKKRSGQNLQVEYNRLDRYQSPTTLRVKVRPPSRESDEIKLAINQEFIDAIELTHVDPEPEVVETDGANQIFRFAAPDLTGDATITFRYEGIKYGDVPVRVGLREGSAVHFSQFFFP